MQLGPFLIRFLSFPYDKGQKSSWTLSCNRACPKQAEKTEKSEWRVPLRLCSELIKAADGGQISLDWFDNDDSSPHPDPASRPTVLLLPGLTGTSRESYILHMVQQSRDLGYRSVVFLG